MEGPEEGALAGGHAFGGGGGAGRPACIGLPLKVAACLAPRDMGWSVKCGGWWLPVAWRTTGRASTLAVAVVGKACSALFLQAKTHEVWIGAPAPLECLNGALRGAAVHRAGLVRCIASCGPGLCAVGCLSLTVHFLTFEHGLSDGPASGAAARSRLLSWRASLVNGGVGLGLGPFVARPDLRRLILCCFAGWQAGTTAA